MDRHIEIVEGVFSPALCDALCRLHEHALLHGGTHRVEEAWRRCTILPLPAAEVLGSTELYAACKTALSHHVDAYKKKHGSGTLNFCTKLEKPSVVSYDPQAAQTEHFHAHADAWSVESATRVLSLILFLNDVAEGGETEFPDHDVSVKPRAGKLLLFPSAFTHIHVAKPPVSSKKYVFISWLHFGGEGVRYATLPF
jgi:2OG-Fe(II) oxygenase superfamily